MTQKIKPPKANPIKARSTKSDMCPAPCPPKDEKMASDHQAWLRHAIIPALLVSLSACAGGSSPTPPSPPAPPPPPPPPPVQDTDWELVQSKEFLRQPAFNPDIMNVIPAYEAGLSGAGILVGHVDTGMNANHVELEGQIDARSTNTGIPGNSVKERSDNLHGTWTGGIIVAKKDGFNSHGIAYGSKLISFNADDGRRSTDCAPFRCGFSTRAVSAALDLAVEAGARVINLSLAQAWELDAELLAAVKRTVDAGVLIVVSGGNQFTDDPAPWPGLIGTHPDVIGGLIIAGATQNDGNNIERARWKANGIPGQTNVGSNAAGYAIDITLFAPGTRVWGPWGNGGYLTDGGTSASAPLIAGAAALIFEHSPHLTGREVAQILFESALDLGAPGDDVIFGQGFLNVGAALQPLGVTQVTSASGVIFPVSGSALSLSPVFGDALSPSVAFAGGILMQDKFRRTYNTRLDDQIDSRGLDGFDFDGILRNERLLQATSLDLGTGALSMSMVDRYAQEKTIYAALPMATRTQLGHEYPSFYVTGQMSRNIDVAGAVGLSAAHMIDRLAPDEAETARPFMMARTFQGDFLDAPTSKRGMAMRYQMSATTTLVAATTYSEQDLDRARFGSMEKPRAISSQFGISAIMGALSLRARGGVLHEQGSILGSVSKGALALGEGATTLNSRIEASVKLSSGYVFGFLTGGVSHASATPDALLSGIGRFTTSSFALGYVGEDLFRAGDQLGIVMSQPLRVESGQLNAVVPTAGRYAEGSLQYSNHRVSLSPTGRELNLEASYRWYMGDYRLAANLIGMRQYGHSTANGVDAALLLRAQRLF